MPSMKGRRLPVTSVSSEDEIRRLAARVGRMESRYECSSTEAAEAVRAGRLHETPEVSAWLIHYRQLTDLVEATAPGAQAGSPTNATG